MPACSFFPTCPCFATLRHSFLGITPHPLASCLAPNPNGRCSPLSFGSLVFQYACLYAPSCLKALHCASISYLFFKPFPAFLWFFQSFLPAISSFSQPFPRFPWFFQACHSFFSSKLIVFSQLSSIFLHVPPVFNDFPSFSLVLSYLFPSVFKGPKENRTPPSPNCLVAHAPLKKSNWRP